MGKSLTPFVVRRRRNLGWLALAVVSLITIYGAYLLTLHRPAFLTGWLLFGAVLLLAIYNLRRRVTMFPIGAASTWMQIHIYGGFFAIVVFVMHIGLRWPDGALERLLALTFVLMAVTGVLGLCWSRWLPDRLTRRGEEVIFERIPAFTAHLRRQAEDAVEQAARDAGSATLADYYREHLAEFFAGPRYLLGHLSGSGRPIYAILNRIDALKRHLDETERVQHARLRELVEKKDDLDFHYALQLALKAWLFVHVPVAGVMLMLTVVHLVTVGAYSGGF